mmetsp:Transcript_20390/g.37154  ORF Transcript_20390/g.37154 Transcript_20390/m.37154 type:complete len:97 (+) Transcript_20390:1301-1591(+)
MGMRGGHPSRLTPTPPPWDSPHVEMRNMRPKELPVPIVRVKAAVVAGAATARRPTNESFMVVLVTDIERDCAALYGEGKIARCDAKEMVVINIISL